MDILTILAVGTLNIVCFYIGAKVGQTVNKGKDIEIPTVNPMKLYKEHKENKEVEMERNKLDIILRNIEKYDGTANGQQDVPR